MAKAAKKKQAEQSGDASLEADELIQAMKEFNTEDSERASDAGESRQRIGTFLEKTKLNNKAFSFFRGLLRVKKESTRLDILRSVELILPAIKAEVKATTTVDAFDTPLAAIKAAEAEKAAESNVIRPFKGSGDPDFNAEVEAFDKAAAENLGE